MATSCASSSAPARSTPSMIARMGALPWRSPKWRWPAASARRSRPSPTTCRATPSCSARTRPATCWLSAQDAAADILYEATAIGVPAALLGVTGGASLILPGGQAISVASLKAAHEVVASRLHGRQGLRSRFPCRWMRATSRPLIKAAIPDAIVEIRDLAGDGDHFAATVDVRGLQGQDPACSSTRWSMRRCKAAWAASCTLLR